MGHTLLSHLALLVSCHCCFVHPANHCSTVQVGQEVSGTVSKIVPFGAFVKLEDGFEVLLPTSEMAGAADELDPNPRNLVKENGAITGTVVKVDRNKVAISNMSAEERAEIADEEIETAEAPVTLGGSLLTDLVGIDNAALQAMVAALPSKKSAAAPATPEEKAVAPTEEGELVCRSFAIDVIHSMPKHVVAFVFTAGLAIVETTHIAQSIATCAL
jgi:predicted RNA-binding protein with RPS1 domain